MADQDFNINIRTLADLTGIKLTQAQLDALQTSSAAGNQKATAALKQLSDAQSQAQESAALGLGGTAAGVGTIISLVTVAITKWKAFNDELDKQVENMIRAEEKARKLGESILDMQDAARSAARVENEPLEQSYVRLTADVIRLKTEMSLLNLPEQGEEWKKLNGQLGVTEGQLKRVTAAIDGLAKAKEKAREKEIADRRAFEVAAFETEAKEAEAQGDTAKAQQARQMADALKRGIPLKELRKDEIPTTPPVVGESPALVNQIERNKQAFIEQQMPKTKFERDPTTGGMKEVPLSIPETNAILRQLLAQWQ